IRNISMARVICATIAVAAMLLAGALRFGAAQPAGMGEFAPWGVDLRARDLAMRPGNDFYRHVNGAWFDRAVIAPDQSSNSIDRELADTAQARVRDILERRDQNIDASAQADAAKIRILYSSFMDEARAETLDATPIAALVSRVRAASSREDFAELM